MNQEVVMLKEVARKRDAQWQEMFRLGQTWSVCIEWISMVDFDLEALSWSGAGILWKCRGFKKWWCSADQTLLKEQRQMPSKMGKSQGKFRRQRSGIHIDWTSRFYMIEIAWILVKQAAYWITTKKTKHTSRPRMPFKKQISWSKKAFPSTYRHCCYSFGLQNLLPLHGEQERFKAPLACCINLGGKLSGLGACRPT